MVQAGASADPDAKTSRNGRIVRWSKVESETEHDLAERAGERALQRGAKVGGRAAWFMAEGAAAPGTEHQRLVAERAGYLQHPQDAPSRWCRA